MSYSRCNRSRCYFESVACIWLDDQLSRLDIRKISFRHITSRTTPSRHMIGSSKREINTRSITRAIIRVAGTVMIHSGGQKRRALKKTSLADARDDDGEVQISTEKRRDEQRRVTQHRYIGRWFATLVSAARSHARPVDPLFGTPTLRCCRILGFMGRCTLGRKNGSLEKQP